ncbi:head-tail adaptor protein [Nonomuraea sp. NPDC003560]|uniref:phage head completion protein n=1 Tax=Nonomuraea sp. NPDC003560 TaxID=3364341 RepID=UPI0036B28D78
MIAHLLNRTLQHRRPSTVRDGGGGQHTTWLPIGAVRARVSQPGTPAEREEGDQSGADLSYPVYLAPGAGVRRGDELFDDAHVYEVLATYTPSEPIYLRADCRRREREEET